MQEGLKKEDCAESRNLVAALTSIVAITAQRQSSISRLIKIRTKIEVFTNTLNGKRSQLFHLVWELGDFRKVIEPLNVGHPYAMEALYMAFHFWPVHFAF